MRELKKILDLECVDDDDDMHRSLIQPAFNIIMLTCHPDKSRGAVKAR